MSDHPFVDLAGAVRRLRARGCRSRRSRPSLAAAAGRAVGRPVAAGGEESSMSCLITTAMASARTSPEVEPTPVRVLIADDHPLFRRGMRRTLECQAEIVVVGEAEDGEQALRLIDELEPDVAVLDYRMPGVTGRGGVRRAGGACGSPASALLLLSAYEDAESVGRRSARARPAMWPRRAARRRSATPWCGWGAAGWPTASARRPAWQRVWPGTSAADRPERRERHAAKTELLRTPRMRPRRASRPRWSAAAGVPPRRSPTARRRCPPP